MQHRLSRSRRNQWGAARVVVALSTATLVLAMALVVDVGNARRERNHAGAVADAAAVAGARSLTQDQTPDPILAAIQYGFGSMSLPAPVAHTDLQGCPVCSYSSGGITISARWPVSGDSQLVQVRVCWPVAARLSALLAHHRFTVCQTGTAKNADADRTAVGPPETSCTPNELTTSVVNPISPGSRDGDEDAGISHATTLVATYRDIFPIDPASIVFIAPDAEGNLIRLSPAQYELVVTATTATITHTIPAGLSTATSSVFVTDTHRSGCGELAWSSCPVAGHDNFIETGLMDHTTVGIADHGMAADGDADDAMPPGERAQAALLADGDDSVFPGPAQQVGPGAAVGATYYDETDIDQAKTVLFLNGLPVRVTFAGGLSGLDGGSIFKWKIRYVLPPSTPDGWNSAFLYLRDADVNQSGGDCSLTQWAFHFSGAGLVALIK